MGYKVRIVIGSGNNLSTSQSVVLPNKARVSNYVKKHPFGNASTRISVENTSTGKVSRGAKRKYYNPKNF